MLILSFNFIAFLYNLMKAKVLFFTNKNNKIVIFYYDFSIPFILN